MTYDKSALEFDVRIKERTNLVGLVLLRDGNEGPVHYRQGPIRPSPRRDVSDSPRRTNDMPEMVLVVRFEKLEFELFLLERRDYRISVVIEPSFVRQNGRLYFLTCV